MNKKQKKQAWEEEFDKDDRFKRFVGDEPWWLAKQDIFDFIRTLRQKDKERLMAGVESLADMENLGNQEFDKVWVDGLRFGYSAALKDVKKLLNQIYE